MRNLVMGCAMVALVALSVQSEARVPAAYRLKPSASIVPLIWTEVGFSSWYGSESAGKTASGEQYDMHKLTAAHRTLPFNSTIKVTNLKNGRAVTLRVNDRGPNVAGRLLDVSRAAAQKLGFLGSGHAPVRVTVIRYPKGYVAQPSSFPLLASCIRSPK